jgi:sugar phosphate isomerase/epimerase
MEIGINLHAIGGMTEEAYVKAMAELGFTATFCMAGKKEALERVSKLCAAENIRFDTLHAPFDHINDIWLEGAGGHRMLAELKDCVDQCLVVGAPIAVVHLSSKQNPPTITDIGRGRFEELVAHAQKKGVKIAFENLRKLFNLAWAMETFTPADGVGFCWDCGHEGCFTQGNQFMPLFGDRLICTHIHDNTCTFNEDAHMLPFDGRIDFQKVARQIRRSGFDGVLMLEAIADASGHYTDMPPQKYLQQAADAAKRLVKMVEADSND